MVDPTIDTGSIATAVRAALMEVHCPCSSSLAREFNLLEMGLVVDTRVTSSEVEIVIRLTEPTCVFGLNIAAEIEDRVAAIVGNQKVIVRFDERSAILWTEEDMTADARDRLRLLRSEALARIRT